MDRFVLSALAFSACGSVAFAQVPPPPSFLPVPDNAILSYNLNGLDVYNGANEKVGKIQDEVIASGRLGGYIVSVGGVLGIGDRYVVIAPSGLIVSYDANAKAWHARIDATKDQLKAAPAFKYEDRWSK